MGRIKVALVLLAMVAGVAAIAQRAPNGAAPAQAAAHDRSKTLDDLATKLSDRFVHPETGAKYAAMLRASAASGKYDAIADDGDFAKQVTADLQAVAFDGHLKLIANDAPPTGGGPANLSEIRAVEETARLTPTIAYIRLGKFFGEADAMERIRRFLTDNADAETLIFDMRTHVGGGLSEMDMMFPLIFAKPTVLVAMDTRSTVDARGGSPLADGPTLRRIASPPGIVRREHIVVPASAPLGNLAKARILVLTSGRTGSAGEHFVLAMKRTHRATIIGDTTYGAGNYGGLVPIAGGFSAFIPVGRTFDPDSGKGWDYVGIAPNVAVRAEEALTEALMRSGVARAEAAKLSARYGPAPDRVTSKRKAPPSVPGI